SRLPVRRVQRADPEAGYSEPHFRGCAALTVVLVETFLRHTIKGECSNCAFQAGCGEAPLTVGTAPAGEVFILGPDHTSTHYFAHIFLDFDGRMDFRWRRGAGIHLGTTRARNVARALAYAQCPTELKHGKVTTVRRLMGSAGEGKVGPHF